MDERYAAHVSSQGVGQMNGDKLKDMRKEYERKLAEVDSTHKTVLEDLKKEYNDNLTWVKSIYERELKAMSIRHYESILKMQDLQEETLQEKVDNMKMRWKP